MIIRHLCRSLKDIFPDLIIDSCLLRSKDVHNLAMLLFETVCFGFVLVSSYKLYQLFNVFFFSDSIPQKKRPIQVMTKSSNEVLSIALHHGVNAEGQLYRLKRGTKLRLVPGPSLLGRHVALYCNYPVTGSDGDDGVYMFLNFFIIPTFNTFNIFLLNCFNNQRSNVFKTIK